MKLHPRILVDGETVDPFATGAVEVLGSRLLPGMVLLDRELGTPAAVVDHRVRAQRGTGEASYLVEDLERAGGWRTVNIHRNRLVPVLAR